MNSHTLRWNDDRDELKRPPTVPSSTSYINHSRDLWSVRVPSSPLFNTVHLHGPDNSDASLSVEVKCVQALGEYVNLPAPRTFVLGLNLMSPQALRSTLVVPTATSCSLRCKPMDPIK